MKNIITPILFLSAMILFSSGCKKKTEDTIAPTSDYKLIFKYHFDSTQVRLNNFGQPEAIAAGHGAQSPHFNL